MERSRGRSVPVFFALVFILTIPFWILGALSARQLLPALPISALAVVCPALAAAILVDRESGRAGVLGLLKCSFDFQRIRSKAWLIPLLLLDPLIKTLAFIAQRLAGVPVPLPQISLLPALALLVVFFVSALGEELGWSGYAIDPLQKRYGALRAALIIGVVWAIWHVIALLQVQRSWAFIFWWSVATIAIRVIIVWLYNNTGQSFFVAAVYHAIGNLTWQLYPVSGSFYDPQFVGPFTALAAGLIVILWGPRTLTGRQATGVDQADPSIS